MVIGMFIVGQQLVPALLSVYQRNVLLPDVQIGYDVIFDLVDCHICLLELSLKVASLLVCCEIVLIGGEYLNIGNWLVLLRNIVIGVNSRYNCYLLVLSSIVFIAI